MTVKAVIFDWAGTMIDHGSRAPMGAFVQVLSEFEVPITVTEARRPMGLPKWDHIKALLTHPISPGAGAPTHGRSRPTRMSTGCSRCSFRSMPPWSTDFADIIPGVLETMASLRARGLKLGSTTGYTREIMERLLPVAASKGLRARQSRLRRRPQIRAARPAHDVQVLSRSRRRARIHCREGRRHRGWHRRRYRSWQLERRRDTVGQCDRPVARRTGSAESAERTARRAAATRQLQRAGAHFVIDSAADLGAVIDAIEGRLARGERPELPPPRRPQRLRRWRSRTSLIAARRLAFYEFTPWVV